MVVNGAGSLLRRHVISVVALAAMNTGTALVAVGTTAVSATNSCAKSVVKIAIFWGEPDGWSAVRKRFTVLSAGLKTPAQRFALKSKLFFNFFNCLPMAEGVLCAVRKVSHASEWFVDLLDMKMARHVGSVPSILDCQNLFSGGEKISLSHGSCSRRRAGRENI